MGRRWGSILDALESTNHVATLKKHLVGLKQKFEKGSKDSNSIFYRVRGPISCKGTAEALGKVLDRIEQFPPGLPWEDVVAKLQAFCDKNKSTHNRAFISGANYGYDQVVSYMRLLSECGGSLPPGGESVKSAESADKP